MTAEDKESAGAPAPIPALPDSGQDFGLRVVRPALAAFLTLGSLAWSADLYRAVGLVLFIEQFLAGMLGVALALVFIHYPAKRKSERTRIPWYDAVLSAVGLAAGLYVAIVFPELSKRLISAPADGLLVSAIFFVLCIEGLRRAVGYSLVVIVLFFVVYALVGHLVPGELETRKVELDALLTYLSLDTSALLGLAMVVGTTIVLTFVFFGQLLLLSGGSTLLQRSVAAPHGALPGRLRQDIDHRLQPVRLGLRRRRFQHRRHRCGHHPDDENDSGFSPRFAASVEAVASTGGQLMPPVMGAVAFLMADFLEMPYKRNRHRRRWCRRCSTTSRSSSRPISRPRSAGITRRTAKAEIPTRPRG